MTLTVSRLWISAQTPSLRGQEPRQSAVQVWELLRLGVSTLPPAQIFPTYTRLGSRSGVRIMPTVTRRSSGAHWSNADLLFLASALDQGMSVGETAGFLGRTEDQVRRQSDLMFAGRNSRLARRRNEPPLARTKAALKAG